MTKTISRHRWDLGSLDLVARDGKGPFWFKTLADGFDLGTAEAVKYIVSSLMRNGSDSRIGRYDNRTITFTVQVKGMTDRAVTDGANALRAQTGGRNTLGWTPPSGVGGRTEFRVLNSTMRIQMTGNDGNLVRDGEKSLTYLVTLECEPHGRSPKAVTQTFTPTSAAPTVVDDCVSTTTWDAVIAPGQGTAVGESTVTVNGEDMVLFTWSFVGTGVGSAYGIGYVDWSGTKPTTDLVAFDVSTVGGSDLATGFTPRLIGDATLSAGADPVYTEIVTIGSAMVTRYWFDNPGNAGTPWRLRFVFNVTGSQIRIANVIAADNPGTTAVFAIPTIGSVPAVGGITCTRATDMTHLFVYADPQLGNGFSPPLALTWPLAVDGTYEAWVYGSATAGQVGVFTVVDAAGRTVTARTVFTETYTNTWLPIGCLALGGFRSGRLGALTVTATINAVAVTAANRRIFRQEERETSLLVFRGIAAKKIEAQAPSLEYPAGAVWVDDVAVHDPARLPAYDDLVFALPQQTLLIEANSSDTLPVTTVADYVPLWADFAPPMSA